MKTLFEEVKEKGILFGHYESDLYIPVTEETKELVKGYRAEIFVSNIDHKQWFNVLFMYDPFWNKVKDVKNDL